MRKNVISRWVWPHNFRWLCSGRTSSAEASKVFRGALSTAAPAGICRAILDQGPPVGTLLSRFWEDARRTGHSLELLPYVERLAPRRRELHNPEPASGLTSAIAASLIPRERCIIELIGHGQSNKEIVRDLGIAPETVKSHVKDIFSKLAVERRAQAGIPCTKSRVSQDALVSVASYHSQTRSGRHAGA